MDEEKCTQGYIYSFGDNPLQYNISVAQHRPMVQCFVVTSFIVTNIAAHESLARKEVGMHIVGLLILAVVGVTSFAALSFALYMVLPEFLFECSARHGRFVGQGIPDEPRDTHSGNAPVSGIVALQSQTA